MSCGDATKPSSSSSSSSSSLPGVSFLFASQSRPNVSPGNGYEFYSDLIFLVPIVLREGHAASSRYQSSPVAAAVRHLGAVFGTFAASRMEKRRTEMPDESSTVPLVSRARISLPFSCFSHRFSSAAPSAFSLRRKQEFRKRPRGREIREGCASRRRDLLVRKYRTRRSFLLLYLGICRLNIATRNLAERSTPRDIPCIFNFCHLSSSRHCPSFLECLTTLNDGLSSPIGER